MPSFLEGLMTDEKKELSWREQVDLQMSQKLGFSPKAKDVPSEEIQEGEKQILQDSKESPPQHVQSSPQQTIQSRKDYGLILLLAPLVSTVLIWFWIGNMNLLQNPSSKLSGLVAITILLTAILATMEVSALKSTSEIKTDSPISYFLFITLLWVIGYPLYFFRRKKWGFSNQVVGAILITVVFCISFFIVWSAIEERKAEIRGIITGAPTQLPRTTTQPMAITKSKYDGIREGMSYEEVVKILGVRGNEVSSSYMEGIPGVMESVTTKMYEWQNRDGSNMNAMFQNNKLVSKAQYGLR